MNYIEARDVINKINPHGLGFKCLQHFIQLYNSKEKEDYFRKYDYGHVENLKRYGSPNPPRYHLENITNKVRLYYGTADNFVKKQGAE